VKEQVSLDATISINNISILKSLNINEKEKPIGIWILSGQYDIKSTNINMLRKLENGINIQN